MKKIIFSNFVGMLIFITVFMFVNICTANEISNIACYNPNAIISFDFDIGNKMLLELRQCREKDIILQYQDERIKLQNEIISGKEELLKIKDDIIRAKNQQITTLQATDVIKTMSNIIDIQNNTINNMKPSIASQTLGIIGILGALLLILF